MAEEIGKIDVDVLKSAMSDILADPTYKENVTELNDDELAIFNADVYDLLRLDMRERTVDMVYAKYHKALLFGCMRAKQMLAVSFTGSDGTAGFGATRIRPEHLEDSSNAQMTTWKMTPTSAGWQNHIANSTTPHKITNDAFGTMVIVGLGTFLANPNVTAYKFNYQGSDKAVQYIEHTFRNSELQIYPLSNPILYARDEEIYSRMKVDTANQPVELFWIGISYAKISWLRAETPSHT